jgi:hypothetical protein
MWGRNIDFYKNPFLGNGDSDKHVHFSSRKMLIVSDGLQQNLFCV